MSKPEAKPEVGPLALKRPSIAILLKNASPKLFDIKLRSFQGDEFDCHKLMLALVSTVFNNMFDADVKLFTENGVLELKDTDSETIKVFLKCIYEPKRFKVSIVQVKKLLKFSEKYQALYIKETCVQFLVLNLNVENCLELAILANQCNAPDLQDDAIKEIIKGGEDLRKLDLWALIKHDFPDIMDNLVRTLQAKYQQNQAVLSALPCQLETCQECGKDTCEVKHYCSSCRKHL